MSVQFEDLCKYDHEVKVCVLMSRCVVSLYRMKRVPNLLKGCSKLYMFLSSNQCDHHQGKSLYKHLKERMDGRMEWDTSKG